MDQPTPGALPAAAPGRAARSLGRSGRHWNEAVWEAGRRPGGLGMLHVDGNGTAREPATPGPLPQYESGSNGPAEAGSLMLDDDVWRAI